MYELVGVGFGLKARGEGFCLLLDKGIVEEDQGLRRRGRDRAHSGGRRAIGEVEGIQERHFQGALDHQIDTTPVLLGLGAIVPVCIGGVA